MAATRGARSHRLQQRAQCLPAVIYVVACMPACSAQPGLSSGLYEQQRKTIAVPRLMVPRRDVESSAARRLPRSAPASLPFAATCSASRASRRSVRLHPLVAAESIAKGSSKLAIGR